MGKALADHIPAMTTAEDQVLGRGAPRTKPPAHQKLTHPRAHTVATYKRLLTESLSVEEAAKRLGVDGSRIRQRLATRTLYGIKLDHNWYLPKFQFDGKELVPGITEVLAKLPEDLSPVAVYRWFTTANPDLLDQEGEPLTPLRALQTGEARADVIADLAVDL
jgi:hypothetical protein